MNAWQKYVTKNPMKAETRRSFRRFFGLGKMSNRSVRFGFILFGILYLFVLGLFFAYLKDTDSSIWAYIETLALLLSGSIGFYSSIAGERERRTWDVLRSLPVTRTQIVVGKFIGALVVISAVWALLLPFNLLSAASATNDPNHSFGVRIELNLIAALVSYFSAVLVIALTLLLSSRSRTSLAALSTSLGILFLWLAVWPLVLGLFLSGPDSGVELWKLTMNPFGVLNEIFEHQHPLIAFFTFLLFCVVGVAILVTWTDRTLSFAEDQVEFIRQKDHA